MIIEQLPRPEESVINQEQKSIPVFENPADLFRAFFASPQYKRALADRQNRLKETWQQTHPRKPFVFSAGQEAESLAVFNRSEEVVNLFLKFGREEARLNYQAYIYPPEVQKLLNIYWDLIRTKHAEGTTKDSGGVFIYEDNGQKQVANIKDGRAYDYLRTKIHTQIEYLLVKDEIGPNKELSHLLVFFLTRSQGIETELSPQDNQKAYIDESNRRYDNK
jgi:hypothetical protein